MKNFIEVSYQTSDVKYCINIIHIVWFVAVGDKTSIMLHDGTRFNVNEAYTEILAKIEAASK
mgnify:CR=1 FL=1